MKLIEKSRNVHLLDIEVNKRNYTLNIAMLSDLHWDNPKCDRAFLKKHLDLCLKNDWRIHLNGDIFCLMQGKYDPRKSKSSIRPEHNVNHYIDAVVDTAADWFLPYAHLIDVVGYGNHETNIIKRLETDPLQRFVDLLNSKAGIEHKVYTGGYGGWYVIRIDNHLYRIRYYHGAGGGGVVTKGAINLTRSKEMYDNFDCFTMGHVHENTERYDTVSSIDLKHRPFDKELLLMITGTYKEEYDDGYMGWHVERGAPPKPIGGRLLTLEYHREDKGKVIKATSKKLQ